MVKEFNNTNLNIIRFDAIHGANVVDTNPELVDKHVNKFCKYLCPRAVIGCGMSHVLVARHFLENDPNDFCLVLEDDVKPLFTDLNSEVNRCVNMMVNQEQEQQQSDILWDIIKVYCHGICSYDKESVTIPNNLLTSSTAAYILSKTGAKKIANLKVAWHIDKQFGAGDLNVFLSTHPLFTSYFDDSSTSEKGYLMSFVPELTFGEHDPPLNYIMGIKVLYEPLTGIDIIGCHIFLCVVLILILLLVCYCFNFNEGSIVEEYR